MRYLLKLFQYLPSWEDAFALRSQAVHLFDEYLQSVMCTTYGNRHLALVIACLSIVVKNYTNNGKYPDKYSK